MSTFEGINSVIDSAEFANILLNKFVVKPPSSKGISGFVFDIRDAQSITLTSDITDHFVEDNSAVQDHISLKPIRLSLRGFVGELNDIVNVEPTFPQTVLEVLGLIAGYVPAFTSAQEKLGEALILQEEIQTTIDRGIAVSENLFDFFTGASPAETKQAQAYQYLKALWASRQMVTVETPWEYFRNMAIESISISEDSSTRFISDISVTFKEIRLAETLTTAFDESKFIKTNCAGRSCGQRGLIDDKGKKKGPLISILRGGAGDIIRAVAGVKN